MDTQRFDCGEHGSCEMYNETSFKCMCAEGYFGANCEYEDELEEPYYPTVEPLINTTLFNNVTGIAITTKKDPVTDSSTTSPQEQTFTTTKTGQSSKYLNF